MEEFDGEKKAGKQKAKPSTEGAEGAKKPPTELELLQQAGGEIAEADIQKIQSINQVEDLDAYATAFGEKAARWNKEFETAESKRHHLKITLDRAKKALENPEKYSQFLSLDDDEAQQALDDQYPEYFNAKAQKFASGQIAQAMAARRTEIDPSLKAEEWLHNKISESMRAEIDAIDSTEELSKRESSIYGRLEELGEALDEIAQKADDLASEFDNLKMEPDEIHETSETPSKQSSGLMSSSRGDGKKPQEEKPENTERIEQMRSIAFESIQREGVETDIKRQELRDQQVLLEEKLNLIRTRKEEIRTQTFLSKITGGVEKLRGEELSAYRHRLRQRGEELEKLITTAQDMATLTTRLQSQKTIERQNLREKVAELQQNRKSLLKLQTLLQKEVASNRPLLGRGTSVKKLAQAEENFRFADETLQTAQDVLAKSEVEIKDLETEIRKINDEVRSKQAKKAAIGQALEKIDAITVTEKEDENTLVALRAPKEGKRVEAGTSNALQAFEDAYKAELSVRNMQPNQMEFEFLQGAYMVDRSLRRKNLFISPQALADSFMDAIGEQMPGLRKTIEEFPEQYDAAWKIVAIIIEDKYLSDNIDGTTFLDFFKSNMWPREVTLDSNLTEGNKTLRARQVELENELKKRQNQTLSPSNAGLLSPAENVAGQATTPGDSSEEEQDAAIDEEANQQRRSAIVSAFTPDKFFAAYNERVRNNPPNITLEMLRNPEQYPNPFGAGQSSTSQPSKPAKPKKITDEDLRNLDIYKVYEGAARSMLQDYCRDKCRTAWGLGMVNENLKTVRNYLDKFISDHPLKVFNEQLNQARAQLRLPQKSKASNEQSQQYDRYLELRISGKCQGFAQFFKGYVDERSTLAGKASAFVLKKKNSFVR